jgi:hypothetical protein
MTEVKIREDEYDLVKNLSQRIKALPSSVRLAKRGRRLLFQGQLLRVQPTTPSSEAGLPLLNDRRKSSADPSKPSSHLVHAIREWDQRRERSGSVKSNGSSATAASFSSYGTHPSAASSEPPLTPSSPRFSSRSTQLPRAKSSGPSRPASPRRSASEETQVVQVFVFTDFVVIAGLCKSRQNGPEDWTLLENIGISKVLGVTQLSGETDGTILSSHSG